MKYVARADLVPPRRAPSRVSGAVAWYDEDKGYGFIEADDGAGEILVHSYCLVQREGLSTGSRVTVDCAAGVRGRYVVRIVEVGPS